MSSRFNFYSPIYSRLPGHLQISQNNEENSPRYKWCRDCQDLAFDVCHDDKHCTVTVSPTILKFAEEALAQGRKSQSNWEEAISKRNDLRTIVTSIQSSVNRLKERVDVLVEENDQALVVLRNRFEDIKQSVSTLDPLTSNNTDFKGFVIQSEHDLKNATKILESFSSFDGALVSVLSESNNQRACGMLNGIIRWNETKLNEIERVNETTESETNTIFLTDARRFIGFFLASVPYNPLPVNRRNKDESKKLKKNSSSQSSPCINRSSIDSTLQLPPTTPIKEISELAYPPINGNRKLRA